MRTGIIIAVLTIAESAFGVFANPTATFHETSIILRDGGAEYSLPDLVDPHPFHVTLHAVAKRGPDYFIVYGSSEMSRGWAPRNGLCGRGVESFIRWLRIRDGKVVERQEGLYLSCWKGREDSTIAWKDGKLIWETDGWKDVPTEPRSRAVSIRLKWVFDPEHPELGIIESEKPTE